MGPQHATTPWSPVWERDTPTENGHTVKQLFKWVRYTRRFYWLIFVVLSANVLHVFWRFGGPLQLLVKCPLLLDERGQMRIFKIFGWHKQADLELRWAPNSSANHVRLQSISSLDW